MLLSVRMRLSVRLRPYNTEKRVGKVAIKLALPAPTSQSPCSKNKERKELCPDDLCRCSSWSELQAENQNRVFSSALPSSSFFLLIPLIPLSLSLFLVYAIKLDLPLHENLAKHNRNHPKLSSISSQIQGPLSSLFTLLL